MAVENLPSASKYRNNILRTDNGFQSVDKPSGVNGLVISDGTIWRGLPLSRTDVSKSTPYDPEGMMKFEAVWFPPIEAPNSPDTGVVMYCDAADGKLKVKTSGGSITHLVEETLIDLS
jgi:hypothetical protein